MEINLKKVFHSWELEVFLLPPCKACTRSFNTSGNMTTPLVCRWTFIAQNQQVSQYLAIWLSCLYTVFEYNLYSVFQVIAGLIAGGSFAEMSDFMPGVKMLLQVAQQQVTHEKHLPRMYECYSKLSANHPLIREYTWSTSSRNPVAFLVLKEMSSQKIYLQDYITVCSNSVYI